MNKSKEELIQYIARLEAVIDSLPFDVWMKGTDGDYIIANRHMSEELGLPKDEIIGKRDHDLYEKPDADYIMASDKEILKGISRGICVSHSLRGAFEEHKTPVYEENGILLGTAGYAKNITQQEKIREELARSEERFRTIFEEAPMGIGIFSAKTGKALQINARYEEIIGRTERDILSTDWKQYSHPDEIEENEHRLDMMLKNQINGFSLDKRLIRPDGEEIWVNTTVTPFRGAGFDDPCYLCMIEDITSRKKAEDEVIYLSYYDQLTGDRKSVV